MENIENSHLNSSKDFHTSFRNQFSNSIEFFPSAFFILDSEEIIIDTNKSGESLLRKNKTEIINRMMCEFIFDKDKEQFQQTLQKAVQTSQSQIKEISIKGTGNDYLPSLFIIKYNELQNFKKGFYSLTAIDFTQQKVKEELIKDSEIRFENMANNAPVMIWIADVEGLFSFVNNVWIEYSGKEIGNLLGMSWLKDVHPEDLENLMNEYLKSFKSRKPFTFEFRLKDKSGKYEWMIIRGRPRLSRDNIFIGFIGSCTNINMQKEFEGKIKKVNEELVEINAAKDKFFSIISHDLRSPLGGLMQILEILNETDSDLEEDEKKEIISEAAGVSKMVFALMENLLEWSRIQTGKIPYNPEKIELLPIVKEIEALYLQNFKNKQIIFSNEILPDVLVFADLRMTNTILRNLISNAIKFSKPNSEISVTAEPGEKFIIIKVKDAGVGIDENNISKLFRTDVSHSTEGTANEKGTGLGLVLCRELVEKQGGKIGVESKKDVGSTFYFTLPI